MKRSRVLLLTLVLSMIAAACGTEEGGTTSSAEEGTTTSAEEETATTGAECQPVNPGSPDQYPWIENRRDPGAEILGPLDCIPVGTEATHQAPCANCVGSIEGLDPVEEGGACGHPVRFVENQLNVVVDDQEQLDAIFEELGVIDTVTDITPSLVPSDEAEEEPYDPPTINDAEIRLFDIGVDPINALEEIDGRVTAWPNYVFFATPRWKFGPASEKVEAQDASAQPARGLFGEGLVVVVDDFTSQDDDTSGHGQFIAHLVERLTRITPVTRDVQFFDVGDTGSIAPWQKSDEWSVSAAAASGAAEVSPDAVINLSLGTYACTLGMEYPPLMLQMQLDVLPNDVVAAAGNDWHDPGDPLFYPAGFGSVTSVGALGWSPEDLAWYAADFSNIYDFNVWAPGVSIVSEIDGQAYVWSGTSFAAPFVSACIASGTCSPP